LNNSEEGDYEELLFWGKIGGVHRDYYIAMGITYSDKYEFPEKNFYYALSSDFKFVAFPPLNTQHKEKIDNYNSMF
jgi:radial spoke head protein 9